MKVMTEKTGGCVVMGDSFSINVFKDSLKKFFETDATGEQAGRKISRPSVYTRLRLQLITLLFLLVFAFFVLFSFSSLEYIQRKTDQK